MKTPILKTTAIVLGALGCLLVLLLVLRPAPQPQTPFAALAGVSALELPQAAARLVADAPPAQRPALAREVVQAVASLAKPGVLPFAVSAICRAAPEVAPEAVGAAVRLQPAETLAIARAAFGAAPSALEPIIASVCREVPQAYAPLAVVAADQVPGSGQKILRALAANLPVLGTSLEQARTYSGEASMAALMTRTTELVEARAQEEVAQIKRAAAEQAAALRAAAARSSASAPVGSLASLEALAAVNKTARVELAALDPKTASPGPLGAAGADLLPGGMQPPPRVAPPLTPYDPARSVEFKVSDSTIVTPGANRYYSAP